MWTDDTAVKTPILTTKYHSTYLTGGTWSPTRPGVFFTTKMDGTMDVWDLFYKHNEPTLTVQVWMVLRGVEGAKRTMQGHGAGAQAAGMKFEDHFFMFRVRRIVLL